MTKKDFELIASCISDIREDIRDNDISIETYANDIATLFSDTLASKNPRFDKEKFLQACGVEVDKDLWKCKECNFSTIWTNYKDGTPICPDCDIDLVQ